MSDPIRLECSLSREYVDRRQKMQGLAERPQTHDSELTAYWVVLGLLITWILLML